MFEAFVFHVRQAAERAGVKWSTDCTAELEADREELERRFVKAAERVAALEARVDELANLGRAAKARRRR